MKLIRSLILFLLISGINRSIAQTPSDCFYTPNWDWLDNNTNNWQAYSNLVSGGVVNMYSPFTAPPAGGDVYNIINGVDYKKEQGWVLLHKNFGCVDFQIPVAGGHPWFVLYNRYRGIIRLFVYSVQGSYYTKAKVVLKWGNTFNNTSLLTFYNNLAYGNDQYPVIGTNEQGFNYVDDFSTNDAWFATDFPVAFDRNTNPMADGFDLVFEVYGVDQSTINLTGNFSFTTESAGVKESATATEQTTGQNLVETLTDGKEFLGNMPSNEDINANFNEISNAVEDLDEQFCNQFTLDLANANYGLQNGGFKDFLLGLSSLAQGLSGGLGIAINVLDFFIGKANSEAATSNSYIQPSISNGNLTLTGSIIAEEDATFIDMQLPGTNHEISGNLQYVGLPAYDCPLGVINLTETPLIKRSTLPVAVGTYDAYTGSIPCGEFTMYEMYESYRIASSVEIDLNASSGLELIDFKIALVGELNYIDPDPNDPYLPPQHGGLFFEDNWMSNTDLFSEINGTGCTPDYLSVDYHNLVLDYLRNGTYNLVELKPYGYRVSTPLLGAATAQNTAFLVKPGTKLKLKISATLKPINPTDDQTPVVLIASYDIDENMVYDDEPTQHPFTWEQVNNRVPDLIFPTSGTSQTIASGTFNAFKIVASEHTIVEPSTPVTFIAQNSIVLEPGFRTNLTSASFIAKIEREGSYVDAIYNTDPVNEYFTSCDPYQYRTSSATQTNSAYQMSLLTVQPNPGNGLFNVILEEGDIEEVKLFDYSGKLISDKYTSSIYKNNLLLDITGLPTGIYFIQVSNKSQVISSAKIFKL